MIADHKVDFARLIDIFDDISPVDFIDEAHSTDEETRYAIIAKTAEYGLIYLVYAAVGEDKLRFITARKAEKWMVKVYEQHKKRF